MSGSPPSVEVQGFVVLLAFQGHAEGVWPFWCRRLVFLSCTRARGVGFFLVSASFWRMRSNMSLAVWVKKSSVVTFGKGIWYGNHSTEIA